MLCARIHGPARVLLVALLLCVLAIRVVVPQGFMWSSDAEGTARMVFCSGGGPLPALPIVAATALAAQHHSDQRDHDGKMVEHPCAFAAAGAAVDLAGAIHPSSTQSTAAETPVTAYRFARPGLGLAAPPPPKTGPPSLA